MIRFHMNEDLADMLLPPDSRWRDEKVWIERVTGREERSIRMLVQAHNILDREVLLVMLDIIEEVNSIRIGDTTIESACIRAWDRCVVTSILDLWRYNRTVVESLTQEDIVEAVSNTTVNPTYLSDWNIEDSLGGFVRNATGHVTHADINHITWLYLSYPETYDDIREWELRVIDKAKGGNSGLQGLYVFSYDYYQEEFFSSIYSDLLLLLFSAPLVFLYLLINMGKPTLVEQAFPLTMATFAGVLLAGITCYGIGLAVGLPYGATHQALMFLLLAVGVDDAFVIVESLKRVKRHNPDEPTPVQIAIAMRHAGVSVTVTSLSDIAAFACGISTTIPLMRSFCVYSAIGILALYILQSTLFPACLVFNEARIKDNKDACIVCYRHKNYQPNKCSEVEIVETFFTKIFGPVLTSIPGKIITLIVTAGMAALMIWSLSNMEKGLSFEKSLPPGSFGRKYMSTHLQYFQNDVTAVSVYCGEMYLHENLGNLETMVEDFHQSPAVLRGNVISWIAPFKQWLTAISTVQPIPLNVTTGIPDDKGVFFSLLQRFIEETEVGATFSNDIQLYNTSSGVEMKWTEFSLMMTSGETLENDRSMQAIRAIADGATDSGLCFAFSTGFLYVEIIEYVDGELIRNFILAGCAVFVVTLLLIVNLLVSFLVLICVVLTTVALGGVLHLWGFLMDGNMVILLTFCVGLSVDFSAHIGYMFMTVAGTRNERARKTLSNIGPAVFHGAITTFLGVSGLGLAKSYSLSIFFTTFLAVVVFGVFHGMFFLPVVLSLIGAPPFENHGDDVSAWKPREPRKVTWPEMASTLYTEEGLNIPRPRLTSSTTDRMQ